MTLGGLRIEPTGKVKKLEAEIARLRAALEEIATGKLHPMDVTRKARKALTKEGE